MSSLTLLRLLTRCRSAGRGIAAGLGYKKGIGPEIRYPFAVLISVAGVELGVGVGFQVVDGLLHHRLIVREEAGLEGARMGSTWKPNIGFLALVEM